MKNLYRFLAGSTFATIIYSCSANSAASADELRTKSLPDSYDYLSSKSIVYASSISNLVSTFPKFVNNNEINEEDENLKVALSGYLFGIRNFDKEQQEKSMNDIEKYYKKIQKLRNSLTEDEDNVLNQYLVKIKTNLNFLKSSLTQ